MQNSKNPIHYIGNQHGTIVDLRKIVCVHPLDTAVYGDKVVLSFNIVAKNTPAPITVVFGTCSAKEWQESEGQQFLHAAKETRAALVTALHLFHE